MKGQLKQPYCLQCKNCKDYEPLLCGPITEDYYGEKIIHDGICKWHGLPTLARSENYCQIPYYLDEVNTDEDKQEVIDLMEGE